MSVGERDTGELPISRLEKDYLGWPEKRKQQFLQTARVMIQTGAAQGSELDFILGKFPGLGKDWVEANPDVQSLMEEFSGRGSTRWLALALGRTHHLTFDHIYQALKHSPLRPYMGDYTVDQPRPFWDGSSRVRVRVIEPQGVDLSDIKRGYYIDQGFGKFSLDANGYLASLQRKIAQETDGKQREVLQGVLAFYQEVRALSFPTLRPQIPDKFGKPRRDKAGREILFPSDHQKAAIVRAAQEDSLAIFDGTGSGKTGIGIGLAEYIGAKRVLVICPASVKGTWKTRISEYYVDNPGVIQIDSRNKKRIINDERYTIVNYELLAKRKSKADFQEPRVDQSIETLSPVACRLLNSSFDLLIVDEGHYINNPNNRSEAVIELAKKTNRRLILTATPIRNSVDDIARMAHLLVPNEFTTPDALRELGQSGVSALCDLLAAKTIRRRTEDLVGLPPFCPENEGKIAYVQVELNPTHRAVYDAILGDSSIHNFSKLRLLRLAAIDHNLVRGGKYKIPFEEQQAIRDLQKAYRTWERYRAKDGQSPFNSDFLVTHGYRHLFIGAHLYYRKGIDQLISTHADEKVKAAWQGVFESTKSCKIKDLIRDRLAKGEKIVVYSGHFTEGILREMIDDVTGEAIMEDLYSFLQREFPDIGIGRIDGRVSTSERSKKISDRDQERLRWQNDPSYKILLTSVPSSSLGIDFTVDDGITRGVGIIGVDLPYTYADFWQMISRVYRFGQHAPVNVWVLEGINTIDKGVHVLTDKKEGISEELFDGVSPDELARQLLDHSKTAHFLEDYVVSPKKEMERWFYIMRGQGVTANGVFLETVLPNGRTIGEAIAELYSQYWEYTYSGHTARLLQQVVDGLRADQNSNFNTIVDAGAGPLILERIMRQESDKAEGLRIVSVDINKHMLESGIAQLQRLGYTVERSCVVNRPMSETGLTQGSADAVVCSLAFHYSSSAEDRGRILAEANRVLRFGGYYFITLPEGYLTPEQYRVFGKALKKFGFEIDKTISGQAKAVDHKDIPYTIWLIAARKVGIPNKGSLTMEEFRFNFEGPKISRYKGDHGDDSNGVKKAKGQDRLIKHEKFVILDPENNFQSKGTPAEVLSRLGLGLDEETIKKQGWKMEIRHTKDGAKVVIRKSSN